MDTIKKIEQLKIDLDIQLSKVTNLNELDEIRILYMGKKGFINELSEIINSLSLEDKKELGRHLNQFKELAIGKINKLRDKLETNELNNKLLSEQIDVTLPSSKMSVGNTHPITRIIEEIEELFISMGYDVVEGPEVESDLYNFELLNLPKGHPARDSQDSFFITNETLLRTQTSPVQVRTMLLNKEKSPIRIICPGKVYRRDNDDATHSHQFTQIEGLMVDKNISMAHLKGTVEIFVKKLFGEFRTIRFRPSFFPFTEPSFEVDVSCFKCGSEGCSLCKGTGWIEILGSGMVHPNVLRSCGYDPEIYTGFAFGMGPERIAMLKYGITDIRDFYTNDIRFLNNFYRMDGGDE